MQFGTQVVLDNVTLDMREGEIAGLIGANGAGKTTLFRLIIGEFRPDLGTVTTARGLEIGYLKQEPEIALERTLFDEVGSVFAHLLSLEKKLQILADGIAHRADSPELPQLMEEYERVNNQFLAAGGHGFETKLHECLGGLGFSQADYKLPMSVLSGGQKCRASLAKLLLADRRFLLLDEPTNHLDIDAVRWLEKYLAGHHGGAVIISHDRYLLDRLCTRILELEHRRVHSFPGNYTNYAQTKEIRTITRQRQFEKDAEFIAKERDFIARHLAGQRSKEAQGRRTRLERRLSAGEFVTGAPTLQRKARLAFAEAETRRGVVLRCDGLTMSFGTNVLFSNLSFQVAAGDRLGITGPNGTGKTSLLKIVLSQLAAVSGDIELDTGRTLGYYAQETTPPDTAKTVLDEFRSDRPELSELQARSILGSFLFTGDGVFKTLGMLSGGEQSRLRLARLILSQPDVLILDEPTNHLDIPSREVLEESLENFPGTIITVSHDRYFLDRIVTRLLVMRPTGHTLLHGNYSDYVASIEQQRAAEAPSVKRSSPSGKAAKRNEKPRKQSTPYDHLSLDEIEALIVEREVELNRLHERFGDPEVCKDPDALGELQEETEALEAELSALNAAWEERGG